MTKMRDRQAFTPNAQTYISRQLVKLCVCVCGNGGWVGGVFIMGYMVRQLKVNVPACRVIF